MAGQISNLVYRTNNSVIVIVNLCKIHIIKVKFKNHE
jgi:hypothetical protein